MAKPRTERSLLFPSKECREQVRKASKDRGFRSEQAFTPKAGSVPTLTTLRLQGARLFISSLVGMSQASVKLGRIAF